MSNKLLAFFLFLFTLSLSFSQDKNSLEHKTEVEKLLKEYSEFLNSRSNQANFLKSKAVYVSKPYQDSTDNPYFDLLSLRKLYVEKYGSEYSVIFNQKAIKISSIEIEKNLNTYYCQLHIPQQIRFFELKETQKDSIVYDSVFVDSAFVLDSHTVQVTMVDSLKKSENVFAHFFITMSYKANVNKFTDYKIEAIAFNDRPYKHQKISALSEYWVSLDDEWQKMISKQLNFPELPTDYYLDWIGGIKELDLSKSEITNFNPIVGFIGLRSLNLSNRPLDTLLYIENCINLQELYISNCSLTSLNGIERLIQLNSLSAAKNEIEDLAPLKNCVNMVYLNLDENKIKDISPLSEMRILQKLHLDLNVISSIEPLRNMLILSELYIKKNKEIESLEPLRGHKTLYKLDCFNTNITSLDPIKEDNRMVHLDCGYTKITTLDAIRDFSELRYLSFCGNIISDYSILNRLDKLHTLNCSSTNISDISLISRMDHLKLLHASHTNFSKNDIQRFKKGHPKVAINYY